MDIHHVRKAAAKLKEAMDLFGRGPLDYYLQELVAAHDLLMVRFAPFQVGDRVVLMKAPDYESSPGWRPSAHFLVPGAAGVVVDAGCGQGGFRFDVMFDDESWIDNTGHQRARGSVVPMEPERKHRFGFGEGWLELELAND
jgi:hypothetical protein